MSPEQLNNRAGRERGYTGTAVDVWAAGVWLTVMLVRMLHSLRIQITYARRRGAVIAPGREMCVTA